MISSYMRKQNGDAETRLILPKLLGPRAMTYVTAMLLRLDDSVIPRVLNGQSSATEPSSQDWQSVFLSVVARSTVHLVVVFFLI